MKSEGNMNEDGKRHLIETDLDPNGWHDEDELILYGCMAMLCRYVDFHEGLEALEKFNAELRANPDPNAPEGLCSSQANMQEEAAAIYRWWKIQKPLDEGRREVLLEDCYGDNRAETRTKEKDNEFRKLEKKIADDEQMMLHRLIEIRQSLWT